MNTTWVKIAFATSAVYDAILALVFLFWGSTVYDSFGIEHPNHMGYLQFTALLVFVFSLMFWRIAADPFRFRDLIPYGIGLKISYCLVVFYHWLFGSIPAMWVPFAWIDVAFLILFARAWRKLPVRA